MNEKDIHELAASSAMGGAIGLAVGVIKGVVLRRYATPGSALRGIGLALFVANLVAWALHDYVASTFTTATAIALSALFAEQLMGGLGDLVGIFAANPLGFLQRLRAAWAGRPYIPSVDEPEAPK